MTEDTDSRLDDLIRVRLTRTEKEQLREDAELAGMTMSEYVRRRAMGRPVVSRADRQVIKELRRQGGLLKHIATQAHGAHSQELSKAVAAVVETIRGLGRDRQEVDILAGLKGGDSYST